MQESQTPRVWTMSGDASLLPAVQICAADGFAEDYGDTVHALRFARYCLARKMFQHSQIGCLLDYLWRGFVAEPGFWRAEAAKVAVLKMPLAILISLAIAKNVSVEFWLDWSSNKGGLNEH